MTRRLILPESCYFLVVVMLYGVEILFWWMNLISTGMGVGLLTCSSGMSILNILGVSVRFRICVDCKKRLTGWVIPGLRICCLVVTSKLLLMLMLLIQFSGINLIMMLDLL